MELGIAVLLGGPRCMHVEVSRQIYEHRPGLQLYCILWKPESSRYLLSAGMEAAASDLEREIPGMNGKSGIYQMNSGTL